MKIKPLKTGESPKNFGSPGWVVFVTVAIFLASQVVVAPLIVGLGHLLFSPHKPLNFDNSIPAQFFFILFAEAAAAWLSIWVVRRRNFKLGSIGLGRRPSWRDLKFAGLGFVAFYFLLIIANIFVTIIAPDISNEKQNLGFNNINNSAQNFLAFISLVVFPPLGEETLIRGYLYSGLRMVWRFWPAVLVTSLFFGAAHLEFASGGPLVWAAALDTFLLSIVLCFLRERTGALYAGMLVHMLNNFIAFGVHFK